MNPRGIDVAATAFSVLAVAVLAMALVANMQHYGEEPWVDAMFIGILVVMIAAMSVLAFYCGRRVLRSE